MRTQEAIVEKWRRIAVSTEPANRAEAEDGIRLAYEIADCVPPPRIIWHDAPYHIRDAAQKSEPTSLWHSPHPNMTAYIRSRAINGHPIMLPADTFYRKPNPRVLAWELELIFGAEADAGIDYVGFAQDDAATCCAFELRMAAGHNHDTMRGLIKICEQVGWWTALAYEAHVSERPSVMRFDEDGDLHCVDGPALVYRNGTKMYFQFGRKTKGPL